MAITGSVCLGASVALISSCAAWSTERVGFHDLEKDRLSGEDRVTVPNGDGFVPLSVLVTVGSDGRVLDAKVVDNFAKADPKPAEATVRAWRFRPPTFEGRPVEAVGVVQVTYNPPEVSPNTHVPFPHGNPSDVEITLERSACFGTCPDYRVTITGDGLVRFSTRESNFPGTAAEVHRAFQGENVMWPGVHEARVAPREVQQLLEKFRETHFMGMRNEYTAGITDSPTYAVTLRVGNKRKQVTDYVGSMVGMPKSVTQIEDSIDEVAGTARWTRGNALTITALKAEGFDFRSADVPELLESAIRLASDEESRRGARELILGALREGVDIGQAAPVDDRRTNSKPRNLGSLILVFATRTGDDELFDELGSRGLLKTLSKAELSDIFANRLGCSPHIAEALVAAGANPATATEDGNPLHWLRSSYGMCEDQPSEKALQMARRLIPLGVPLEARDGLGWTVLMGVDDPDLARILLDAGANPNAKAKDGTTPLLATDDDRVGLLLLRHGANPNARNDRGTVRKQTSDGRWPATLRWLNEHP